MVKTVTKSRMLENLNPQYFKMSPLTWIKLTLWNMKVSTIHFS